jgi:hypothetical protein
VLSRNNYIGVAASRAAKSRTPSIEVKPRHGARDIDQLARSALTRRSSLLGVLQNDAAPMIVDNGPFFDLLQGSKAAKAGQVVV